MKKIYLLLALALISGSVCLGQITLTGTANNPYVGMTNSYYSFDALTIGHGPDGASQTFDYSAVVGSGPTLSTFVDASTLSVSTDYPSANIGVTEASGFEGYYVTNSTEYSIAGIYSAGAIQDIYTDQRELMKFPITYLDVFNETFSGTQEQFASGVTWNRGGTINITATAFGDLILPYGTVSNTLKITVVTDYTDTWMTTTVNYVDSLVLWYNTGAQNYICSWDHFYFNGTLSAGSGFYADQSMVGLLDDFTPRYSVSVYPNPVTSGDVNLFVESDQSELISASIYDISGKLLKQMTNLNDGLNALSVNNLSSGLYAIRFSVEGKAIRTEKLVIK
ncbi:MAG: hypothetical protein ACI9J3_000361 [Parvicellaceae bacterium]|jgi:hypothetical protein